MAPDGMLTNKMLWRRSYTLRLDSTNMGAGELARQERVLRVALEVASAKRMAVNAHCGRQAHRSRFGFALTRSALCGFVL